VAALLEGVEPETADDRGGTGEDKAGNVADEGSGWRRIATGGEGGGDTDEPAIVERAIDRPPIPMNHLQGGAMKPPADPIPPLPPVRPNGNPPRIVDKRIGKNDGSSVVIRPIKGANFHAPDLALEDAYTPRTGRFRREGRPPLACR
jgi:hypothetical protein